MEGLDKIKKLVVGDLWWRGRNELLKATITDLTNEKSTNPLEFIIHLSDGRELSGAIVENNMGWFLLWLDDDFRLENNIWTGGWRIHKKLPDDFPKLVFGD